MKKAKGWIVAIIIIGLVGAGIYAKNLLDNTLEPINADDKQVVQYHLKPGSTPNRVVEQLAELNLIKHPKIANLIIKKNNWSHIQAGEYELSPSMTLEEMFTKFGNGETVEPDMIKFVIPEGYTLEYIASKITTITNMTIEDILIQWNDPQFLAPFIENYWFLTQDIMQEGVIYPLEGYIYPATYSVLDQAYTLEEITYKLLDVTASKLDPIKTEIDNSNLSTHEIFALASLIEAETPTVEEMPTVAGVFNNRINLGMKLESDTTVQYILGDRVVRVTEEMTNQESPYNTYYIKGIPVGPIGSPSLDAIKAVLNPENHDYIFFIGDLFSCLDGKTYFFETYTEHMAFYREYLLPSYQAGSSVCK
ncbi:MAG: endolytic transglycosylase MltG [Turicibacter sp.]